jgi:hypothetical protein
MSSAHQTMAFKNEVVSDEDIDRYNLPFPKGGGRWWTRDAERDYYLWGGLSGNLAFDDVQEGWFYLYVDGTTYWIKLLPGKGSESLRDSPYIIKWNSVARIEPNVSESDKYLKLISILKEALVVYGFEGQDDDWVKNPKVVIGF